MNNNIMETVTIRPKKGGMTTALNCQTRIDGRWYVLTENFLILTVDELRNSDLNKEKMKVIEFNSGAKKNFRFSFYPNKIYSVPEGATDQERRRIELQQIENQNKQKAATDFFACHMQIQPEGLKNPYMESDFFIMEFQNQQTINKATLNDKKFKAYQKLSNMTTQERYDAAIYYKPDLMVARHSEVMVALGDFGTGVLMNDPLMTDFLTEYDNNPLVVIQTYVNKALQLNLLRMEPDLGIFYGQEYLGKDSKEAALYFHQKERTVYDNIVVKEVNAKLKMPEDDMAEGAMEVEDRLTVDTKLKEQEEVKESVEMTKKQMLIARANALGIPNAEKKTVDQLKKALAKVEEAVDKGELDGDKVQKTLQHQEPLPKEKPPITPTTDPEETNQPGEFVVDM